MKVLNAIAVIYFIFLVALAKADATLTYNFDYTKTANQVASINSDGSGLGLTVNQNWQDDGGANTAVSPSPQCCIKECYCGQLSAIKNRKQNITMYIAKTQSSYSMGGATGAITTSTQNDVAAFEWKHYLVRKYSVDKANAAANGEISSTLTTPKKADSTAQSTILGLAPQFISCREIIYGTDSQKSQDLEHYIYGNVINGVWQVVDNSQALGIVEGEIDGLSNDAPWPSDTSTPDCQ